MHFFAYKGKRLLAEGVSIERLAKEVGTPVYVYSKKTLKRHYSAFHKAFSGARHIICYSIKANSNLSVLKTFADAGSGFDIVSAGELYRALKAGADPRKIVFSGVGKRVDELEYGLKKNILMFNVESGEELTTLNSVAKRLKKKAPFSIRVNPDVDAKTHPYISTGLKKNKFGIRAETAIKEYIRAKEGLKNLVPMGVDCHIGSQLTAISPFLDALRRVKGLLEILRIEGIDVKYLDIGGGLGITYDREEPPHPSRYGEAVLKETNGLGLTLIFEPGRVMVGNAGVLVTRVLYTKETPQKNFVIVDAGMNDLARPSLYGSYHAIKAARNENPGEMTADVVGPICESGDFLAKDRLVPKVKSGDCLVVMSAGAYGFSMSSNYNSRLRPAEVMVDGRSYRVVRKRETLEDLVNGENLG